ncbi:MAG: riboflavin biosynthesis protein RibF [Chthonomonadaceae bacterium]|nr:riboflavin biosynthesis protein RibF [Chthonomonadaceae bacterium]
MDVQFGLASLSPSWDGAIVCIGTFDGVHLGHQEVVKTAVEHASKRELPCVVVTFDRHPAATLAPELEPCSLCNLNQKLGLLASLGVSTTIVFAFDKSFSETEADVFYEQVLVRTLKSAQLVVGHDFAFGKGRKGSGEWLAERIATVIVPPVELEGLRVSSSAIRTLVLQGQIDQVKLRLGRPHALSGVVCAGQRLGRKLGFPTINVRPTGRICAPKNGIYAGKAITKLGEFIAAISIGVRPTVGGLGPTIEAHLLDYPGDSLYGQSVCLEFDAWIRPEEKFASLEELKAHIGKDIVTIRGLMNPSL